jgi:hypothetical protein
MTELLSLNEDETVHCYTCNHDGDLDDLSVFGQRAIALSVVVTVRCAGCGRDGELHLDRGPRAGDNERRAIAALGRDDRRMIAAA